MKTLVFFILKRIISNLDLPFMDPKGYLKDRMLTYAFSLVRPSDWVFVALSLLLVVGVGIELIYVIISIVHDVLASVGLHFHSNPAVSHWANVTMMGFVFWVFGVLALAAGLVTRVMSIVQRIAASFTKQTKYNLLPVSWMLLFAAMMIHVLAFFA